MPHKRRLGFKVLLLKLIFKNLQKIKQKYPANEDAQCYVLSLAFYFLSHREERFVSRASAIPWFLFNPISGQFPLQQRGLEQAHFGAFDSSLYFLPILLISVVIQDVLLGEMWGKKKSKGGLQEHPHKQCLTCTNMLWERQLKK